MRRIFLQQSLSAAGLRALASIDAALMPRRCVFCGLELAAGMANICAGCDRDLPRNPVACGRCALPLPLALPPGVDCGGCQRRPPPWDAALAPLRWAFPIDAAIKAMKFRRRLYYLPAFQSLLLQALPGLPAGIDAVQPVPLNRWRRMRRGFNQARELAAPVAAALGVPLLNAVRRHRRTRMQSELPAAERRRNPRNAFRLRTAPLGEHLLLVDDVMTTGATLQSLAGLLRRCGIARISVLVLARAA